MKSQAWKAKAASGPARSDFEHDRLLPLLARNEVSIITQSARGLAQSKTWRCFGAALVFLAFAIISHAQNYSLDGFTIDGGGGTSTGGVFSVSGTAGQPDAGSPMTNGQYSVAGGFWALPTAVQVTGAPTLVIVRAAPGQASISWVPATPGFVLQETLSLFPTNWVNSASGATNPLVVPGTLPTKFYRLFKP